MKPAIPGIEESVGNDGFCLALARKLPLVAHQVQKDDNGGFVGMALVEQIIQLIEQRAALTIRRLSTAVGDDDAIAAMTQ